MIALHSLRPFALNDDYFDSV